MPLEVMKFANGVEDRQRELAIFESLFIASCYQDLAFGKTPI
jgi:hypothetical protein